ncbi:MAG: hypothetical protein D6701_05670, partial [Gemmatimonadetes bacterium]
MRGRPQRAGATGARACLTAAALFALLGAAAPAAAQVRFDEGGGDTLATAEGPLVVASKPFGESYILGEMFAQLLESRGIRVERRLGLGATEIAFRALRTGAVDVYPEYTGTGLVALLGETPSGSAGAVFRRVATVFPERWGVHWLPPLGFENTYAIAMRDERAESLGIRTLRDLARHAPALAMGG